MTGFHSSFAKLQPEAQREYVADVEKRLHATKDQIGQRIAREQQMEKGVETIKYVSTITMINYGTISYFAMLNFPDKSGEARYRNIPVTPEDNAILKDLQNELNELRRLMPPPPPVLRTVRQVGNA